MKFGIENEHKGLEKYAKVENVTVTESGLWMNKNYVHLAATPDGLMYKEN